MFLNPQAVLACCSPSRVASCTPHQEFRECWRVLKRIIVNLIRESWNKYFVIRIPDSFLLEEKVEYYFILNLSNLWVLFAGACRHAYNGFIYTNFRPMYCTRRYVCVIKPRNSISSGKNIWHLLHICSGGCPISALSQLSTRVER